MMLLNSHFDVKKSNIIAIDFDGTCVKNAHPNVGESIDAEPVLKALVDKGHRLVLWTMRDGEELKKAVAWFKSNKIELFGVQRHPLQRTLKSNSDITENTPKPHVDYFIDDRNGAPFVSYKL